MKYQNMKLSEAFNEWSQAPRNLVLSAKYRAGVNTVLMKKYGDTDLSAFTKEFSADLMRKSSATHQLKVQAASALVYTLQWGGDHGHCERPSFAFSEIVPAKDTCHGARHAETYHGAWHADRSPANQVPGTRDRSESQEPPIRKGGRPPKAVAQIDPETLTVVKTWPCMAVVDAALGIGKGNVSRAVKKHQKAAGHFWCHADQIDDYIKELKNKYWNRRRDSGKPISVPGPSDRSDDLTKISELKKQYETFNQMRPISGPGPSDRSMDGFTDQELFAELERRGWHGYFSKTEIQTIGCSKSQNISI